MARLLESETSRRNFNISAGKTLLGLAFLPLLDNRGSKESPHNSFDWSTFEIPAFNNPAENLVLVMDQAMENKGSVFSQETGSDTSLRIVARDFADGTFADPRILADKINGRVTAVPAVADHSVVYLDNVQDEAYAFKIADNAENAPTSSPFQPVSVTAPVRASISGNYINIGMPHLSVYLANQLAESSADSETHQDGVKIQFAQFDVTINQWKDQFATKTFAGWPTDTKLSVQGGNYYYLTASVPDNSETSVLRKGHFDPAMEQAERSLDNVQDYYIDRNKLVVKQQDSYYVYDWSGADALQQGQIPSEFVEVEAIYNLENQGLQGLIVIGKNASAERLYSIGLGKLWTTHIFPIQLDKIHSLNAVNGRTVGFIGEKDGKSYLVTGQKITPNTSTI